MNQIFLGQPSDYIKNWFITKFPSWPTYTTLKFVDGTTQKKEINGTATRQNIFSDSLDDCGDYEKIETIVYCQLGKNVTEISSYAFDGCSSLTSISIPNSITSIGGSAFVNCHSLSSISIPSSVTSIGSIGHQAFNQCPFLTSITVDPNNPIYDSRDNCNAIIGTLSNMLIQGCGNTIIPNSVTSIGINAFNWCFTLTSVTIPNSVTLISDFAFWNCSSLTSVTITSSVISIGYSAFANCRSLTSISIPSSVTSIESTTFLYDDQLTSVIFEGRTSAQITAMANYPWGISNTSAIKPGIS